MKTILALLFLSILPLFSQSKQDLLNFLPMGKIMAEESYLAQGGGWVLLGQTKNRRFVYRSGPIKNLTHDKAKMKFEKIWARTSGKVKEKWARTAYNSGRGSDVMRYLELLAARKNVREQSRNEIRMQRVESDLQKMKRDKRIEESQRNARD